MTLSSKLPVFKKDSQFLTNFYETLFIWPINYWNILAMFHWNWTRNVEFLPIAISGVSLICHWTELKNMLPHFNDMDLFYRCRKRYHIIVEWHLFPSKLSKKNLKMTSVRHLVILVPHRVLVRSDLEAHRVLVISGWKESTAF